MLDKIETYWTQFVRFWAVLGQIILTPVEEVSYRARRDKGLRPSISFLAWALLVWAVMIALIAAEDITDMTRFVVFVIGSSANAVLGFLAYSIAWKLFRYEGDKYTLMRIGFYFSGFYTVFLGLVLVLQNGAFKVLAPGLYEAYFLVLTNCEGGILVKQEALGRITASEPALQTVNTVLGSIVLVGLLVYWIASIRVYLTVFASTWWQRWGTLVLGSALWVAFMPLSWLIMISLGRSINGC